jgi:predicted dehydrogenase
MPSSISPKLNIAIIGGGLIGPRHAQSILKNPSANLIALVDPASHGPQTAASLNTTHYSSISSLLSSPHRPDAAIIYTPNSTHVPLSLELIAAGIHVLVEKPISTNIQSGLNLIDAAKKQGVKLLVGHHRRFNPYLVAAKQALDTQSLGKVIALQGIWCLKKLDEYYNGIGEWRRSGESGGVVLINLIHEVDLLQYLLGPINFVSAIPAMNTRSFDAEEGAAILLRFQSGVVGTFILSDAAPSPWNFEGGTGENPIIPKVGEEEAAGGFYRFMVTEASMSVPDLTRWSGKWNEPLKREQLEVDTSRVPFDLQVQHFVEVVMGVAEPNCTGEEALSAMVVCEAVKRAMDTGAGVSIEGFEIKERNQQSGQRL